MAFLHSDPRKDNLDLSLYAPNLEAPETMYGLPQKVTFCKKCVISNQRPNSTVEHKHTSTSKKQTINFDKDGICDACRVAERKHQDIDWEERRRELEVLCDKYRSRNGSYDCLVPGSGGKDSFYQSWMLKYEFGMNPLTVTWAPHIYTDWGWRNFDRWIHSGFDNYLMTPNGRVKRLITRLAVENLFHPFQPFIVGQKSYAPQMAIQMQIPLVFYGEDEAEYGNPIADTTSAQRNYTYFSSSSDSEIFLGGTSVQSLQDDYGVRPADLKVYCPSNPDDLRANDINVHYLGYYLKWHPQAAYYFAVEKGGFEASPHRTPGTYSKYHSLDDRIDDLHYYTTHIKFGIGRATHDAAQEIRSGDIEREEGVALCNRYDGEYPERFSDQLMAYLSLPEEEYPQASKMFETPIIDRDYFEALSNRFRPPHLWSFGNEGWKLRHRVANNV
ncbi:N-acetyl sugar amidotransferase [Cohaesibacter celericrescens]|uniref:N-acetyl sugar amidotransferase n=1 Tax=Cohaesibacter celericrescens TaxID=2067669 RepID=A0A2N5XUI8_9HYPH|nr:N-acetyl sugar amidotransferase [Cohaesibacter celericrescens]PLW78140.1 N-acetyl sugar amidotransferase [Cohaesibacter celericrescens]